MSLTSDVFVAIAVLTAAAALGACVWLLPRVPGSTVRHVVARLGLVALCQLCLVTAFLAVVNSYFDFYPSFRDLTGGATGVAKVVEPAGAGGSGGPATAPVTAVHDPLAQQVQPGEGRLDAVLIHGLRSGISAPAYVYLPPSYAQSGHTRFPTVMVLTGDAHALAAQLPTVAAQLIAAKQVQPTVYVLASLPRDAGCADAPGGTQAETFLSQDVPTAVASAYRVVPDARSWGLLGDTAGGYCAAMLATRHSDQFTAAVSAAGSYTAPAGNLYGGSAAIRNENDLLWRLRHRPPPPVSILLVTDAGNEPQAQQLLALVRSPTHAESVAAAGGATSLQRDLPSLLPWLNAQLAPGR